MSSLKEFIFNLVSFYDMDWFGFAAGHYFTWIVLGGLAIVALEAYLKTHKNKNDVRRFLVDEHRG